MKPLVAIVDDSLTVRMDLRETLEGAGFETVLCASVAELRATLAHTVPHLLVLDVHLPDGNGREVLADIRGDGRTSAIPVLLLTYANEVHQRVAGIVAGADEYVGKPYDREYLVSRALALVRAARPDRPKPLILAIDDSVTIREQLREAIEAAGMQVATASDGEEGLRLVGRLRPDGVVIDYHMPGIDGATVLRRIRADRALQSTICLMLTGSSNAPAEHLGLESGADAYARKGDPLDLVIARLSALLREGRDGAGGTSSWLEPKKVLLVSADDGPAIEAVCEAARQEVAQVVRASSLDEARQVLDHEVVHCVILASVSPGTRAFCRDVKDQGHRAPLVVLVPDGRPDLALEALQSGADDYLPSTSGAVVIAARLRTQILRRHIDEENERIRRQQVATEMAATEARAARELAETRARLLATLEQKNEQLERARKEAQEASDFKSRFLANMSHEIRTPLNAIQGFSDLMANEIAGPLSERQRLYVDQIASAARHLLAVIEDVLDISTIEAGKLRLELQPCNFGAIASDAAELVRPIAHASGQELIVDCDDLPNTQADPVRMRQVLYNLLSNAIKFTEPGGTVTLRGSSDDAALRVAVQDTGIGIPESRLADLFRPFERVETPGRRRAGTGLGLSLVRRIVELHGGRVEVESAPGIGSTFTVSLPLTKEG